MTRRPMPLVEPRSAPDDAAVVTLDRWLSDHLLAATARFDWRRDQREQQLLPELAMQISRRLRSGRPLELALSEAAESGHGSLRQVSDQIAAGRPMYDAIEEWATLAKSEAEQLLVAALLMGAESGGDIARALDLVGDGIRDDLQLDARRRTLLTQSRVSAGVLVSLPVVFAGVASLLQGQLIYRGLSGLVLLAIGVGLDLVGLAWIKRLLRGLQ